VTVLHRYSLYQKWKKTLDDTEGGLDRFSKSYERFGLHVQPDGSIIYREWAPGAATAALIGDFSEGWLVWSIFARLTLIGLRFLVTRISSYEARPIRRLGDYIASCGRSLRYPP
jgi:hypothetical protein